MKSATIFVEREQSNPFDEYLTSVKILTENHRETIEIEDLNDFLLSQKNKYFFFVNDWYDYYCISNSKIKTNLVNILNIYQSFTGKKYFNDINKDTYQITMKITSGMNALLKSSLLYKEELHVPIFKPFYSKYGRFDCSKWYNVEEQKEVYVELNKENKKTIHPRKNNIFISFDYKEFSINYLNQIIKKISNKKINKNIYEKLQEKTGINRKESKKTVSKFIFKGNIEDYKTRTFLEEEIPMTMLSYLIEEKIKKYGFVKSISKRKFFARNIQEAICFIIQGSEADILARNIYSLSSVKDISISLTTNDGIIIETNKDKEENIKKIILNIMTRNSNGMPVKTKTGNNFFEV